MAHSNVQREQVISSASPVSSPRVKPFDPSVSEAWDRFVFEHPRASFFHRMGWKKVVEKTFGYEPLYFYCERDGKITGIAPFFRISNWLVGQCIVSIPLAAYGGICAADDESEQALLNHVKSLAESDRVEYLELRHRAGGLLNSFHANQLYVGFTTSLSSDTEMMLKRLPKDTRYMVRKAEKGGLRAEFGAAQLADFYRLFALSMQRLGTPVFPLALFQNLLAEFPEDTQLMMVYKDLQPVTGVLSFFFRDAILPYYAGASPDATRLAANNFMYWNLMKWAGEAGFKQFDFGRSKKGTGSFAFKSQWNMNVEPLDYQVYLVKRKTVPNFSPLNPKFEMAIRIWKRLPLPLTTLLGPQIVRWIP